ncbi:hypothetical protein O7A70_13020 [Mesorhizobium sp. Cs1299R1N1]|uniref:hypothetical protein n=1 Tax=Mesorhizobium sp. Cs1299R1N1 TaxID=3015172 RepID=UPI00301D4A8B
MEQAAVASCLKTEVLRAFGASPTLSLAWIEHVTQQLHAARALIELRNIRSAEERVLQHLRLRADAEGKVVFKGRLLDVAAELGLTHEAYYRALAGLVRSGAVGRDRRQMCLRPSVRPSM